MFGLSWILNDLFEPIRLGILFMIIPSLSRFFENKKKNKINKLK